ncbi:MAG: hypothetical protein WA160_01365 [Pseudobdellovibrio sp.]
MKKNLILSFVLLLTAFVNTAQAIESCDIRFKPLYKDIQVFKQTEKIIADNGVVGYHLHQELKSLKAITLSVQEKVHSIEVSFVNCDMDLNEADQLDIDMIVEAILKSKNPLDTN